MLRFGIGAVERFHERVGHAANDEAIDRPAAHLGTVDLGGVGMIVDRRVVVLERERLEAGPAHAAIERAGDSQHAVAHRLGVEPAAVLSPEEAVIGVDRGEGGVVARCLPIDRAADDQAMEGLERLAVDRAASAASQSSSSG